MEYLISIIIFTLIPSLFFMIQRKYLIKKILKVLPIFLVLGTIWDYIAIERGWWSYGSKYILGPKIIGIPIEDFLFFMLVPMGVICIYEFFRKKR